MSIYLKKIVEILSIEARECLDAAISFAVSRTHHEVEIEHLILVLITKYPSLIEHLCLNAGLHGDELLEVMKISLNQQRSGNTHSPVLSESLVEHLEKSWFHASAHWHQTNLPVQAFLASLLTNEKDNQTRFPPILQHALLCDNQRAEQLLREACTAMTIVANPANVQHSAYSALMKFTRNLTEEARNCVLDPALGRGQEIRQIIDVLLRRRQNNPVLTGEPGVGKTALVEGLAQRIVEGTVPDALKSMEILSLDMGLLQAGASLKGEFENRLQTVIREIKEYPSPIILFIDEAHTMVGAGGQAGQNDAANLLKPALARGELRVVAATTWAEYKKYFEKDGALARRFQVVKVIEPNEETAISMLRALKPSLGKHHKVHILESALLAAVRLSSRYISGRQLPDKSISLLDTACARVAVSQCHEPKEIEELKALLDNILTERESLLKEAGSPERMTWLDQRESEIKHNLETLIPVWKEQQTLVARINDSLDVTTINSLRAELAELHKGHALVYDCVDAACVADVIAGWTGIPLGRMMEKEQQQLSELVSRLEARIIGQPHALSDIAQQIRIGRANLSDPVKPTGVFMLAGPSGVGKTETALALSELLYGGEQSLITINMSEYQEAHSVSGLKGSPPGYVGYGQGGILTEAVRRRPYSVVLLDEVEKAHPDVMEIFYQVFDKGFMEDAEGQIINFRNTVIILTSNLASDLMMTSCETGIVDHKALTKLIRPEFDRFFRSALMGRLRLIPYLPVVGETLAKIIRIKLNKVCERFATAGGGNSLLTYSEKVVEFIANRCQVKQSGAREIDAVMNRELLPLLADRLLAVEGKIDVRLQLIVSKNDLHLTKHPAAKCVTAKEPTCKRKGR
ncbi:type VI secretion system ATPase TssH (plasmid) [Hafnia alvei]|uniref:type VI secretion system ATPase TssH n=1 Tax=Hafnia alvei TaxID=569 RepID=UPI000B713CEC|nr:type VI secretion system ATPase TssH [Hafnia alvei]MBI0278593.1 type VI secretion system ATPase TssH [Hafnia alvei]PNL03888.1 type VI secretion system ATPase TssH [Hafnia alvei]